MMKKSLQIIFLLALPMLCSAQNNKLIDATSAKKIDTLKRQLILQSDDSSRIYIMSGIGFLYEVSNVDSALKYYQVALNIARQREFAWGETLIMTSMGGVFRQQGKLAESLDLLLKSLKIARDKNLPYHIARAYRRIADIYFDLENLPKAIEYVLQALKIDEQNNNKRSSAVDYSTLGEAYEKMNKLDSATFYIDKAFIQSDVIKDFIQVYYEINGNILAKKGNYQEATFNYQEGLIHAQQNGDLITSSRICADISELFMKINRKDSAIFFALKGFKYGQEVSFKKGVITNASLLAEFYDSDQPALALKYFKIAAAAKDSLFGVNNIQTIQNLVAREEAKQKELEDVKISFQNRLRWSAALATLLGLIIVAFMLYRNNKQKQKANSLLTQQKEKVENTLKDLKSAQTQLIQSEKMASLGELTAGIAHEIQNPLNFVNNFSEVSGELLAEMDGELEKGNIDEAKVIAADVRLNLEKINHHGKRAADIVKGMLQHSRNSSGQKELTDINALADQYLRLAYHGLRAKDKSFNAGFIIEVDEALPKISVLPQDIGRVLLNLINNAFYAVSEKQKLNIPGYEPTVSVSTSRSLSKSENSASLLPGEKVPEGRMGSGEGRGEVLIKVKDNGNGIPQKVLDKIYQPFFTTKPTGQGTGLGLSMSYEIVSKAHGGELKVDTKEGEGAEFTIILPV